MKNIMTIALLGFFFCSYGYSQEKSFPFDFKIFKDPVAAETSWQNFQQGLSVVEGAPVVSVKLYGEEHHTRKANENERMLVEQARNNQLVFLTEGPLRPKESDLVDGKIVSIEDPSVYVLKSVVMSLDLLAYMNRSRNLREVRELENTVGLQAHTLCLSFLSNSLLKEFISKADTSKYSGVLGSLVQLLEGMATAVDVEIGKKLFEDSEIAFWKIIDSERESYIGFLSELALFFVAKFEQSDNFMWRLDFTDLRITLENKTLENLGKDDFRRKYFVDWRNLVLFQNVLIAHSKLKAKAYAIRVGRNHVIGLQALLLTYPEFRIEIVPE